MLANSISTVCFVPGPEKGARLALSYGMEAAFLNEDQSLFCTLGMALIL